MERRLFLKGSLATGTAGLLPRTAIAALLPTPPQTEGPFYPPRLPLDHDNDLLEVAGRNGRAGGTPLHLFGRILDRNGDALPGMRLQIWQCDINGIYHHPRDRKQGRDANFQGIGQANSDEQGAVRFRTIKPVPYSWRAPHIHIKVFTAAGSEALTTQLYLADDPLNERDGIYRSLEGEAERQALTITASPAPDLENSALSAGFQIVLG